MSNIQTKGPGVLTTTNYDLFKRIQGNRTINKPQVKKLLESIAENPELIQATPIIVNDKMEVLDGQHRLEALRKLKLPVSYIKVAGLKLHHVQVMNSATKVWSPADYARSYAELGNSNYEIYLKFKKKYSLPHTTLLTFLSGKGRATKNNTVASFKAGKFEVGDEKLADKACQQLLELKGLYPRAETRQFSIAFFRMVVNPKYDHARMMSKMTMFHKLMVDTPFVEEYMRQLEKIYNHHSGVNRVKLF